MGGGGGGEVVGVDVVGSVGVGGGVSHEMGDGGSAEHSNISLMNSQSVSGLKLKVMVRSSGFGGSVYELLISVLALEEEKIQVSGVMVVSIP